MSVFGQEKAVKKDSFRPKVFHKELEKIRLPDAETEALVAMWNSFDFLKFNDPDAKRFDVLDDLLRIFVDVNLADVVVGCEISSFPCHSTIRYLLPNEKRLPRTWACFVVVVVVVVVDSSSNSLPLARKS